MKKQHSKDEEDCTVFDKHVIIVATGFAIVGYTSVCIWLLSVIAKDIIVHSPDVSPPEIITILMVIVGTVTVSWGVGILYYTVKR